MRSNVEGKAPEDNGKSRGTSLNLHDHDGPKGLIYNQLMAFLGERKEIARQESNPVAGHRAR
ncbi:MAG: hypothetical protein ACREV1_00205, partial [Gammaproteobacteria bacterium]